MIGHNQIWLPEQLIVRMVIRPLFPCDWGVWHARLVTCVCRGGRGKAQCFIIQWVKKLDTISVLCHSHLGASALGLWLQSCGTFQAATLSGLAWNWLRFQLWFFLTLYECVRQYKCMEPASKIDSLPLYVKTEHRPTCATRSAQSAKLPLWCAFIRVVVTWLNCPSWPITFTETFNGIFLQLSFIPNF